MSFVVSPSTESLHALFLLALKKASGSDEYSTSIDLHGLPPSFAKELRTLFALRADRAFLTQQELAAGMQNITLHYIGRCPRIQQILNAICRHLLRLYEKKSYPEEIFGLDCGMKTLRSEGELYEADLLLWHQCKEAKREKADTLDEEDEDLSEAYLESLDSAEKIRRYRSKAGKEVGDELDSIWRSEYLFWAAEEQQQVGVLNKPVFLRSDSMGMEHVNVALQRTFFPDAVTAEALTNMFPDFFTEGGSGRDAMARGGRRDEFTWICATTKKTLSKAVISRGELTDALIERIEKEYGTHTEIVQLANEYIQNKMRAALKALELVTADCQNDDEVEEGRSSAKAVPELEVGQEAVYCDKSTRLRSIVQITLKMSNADPEMVMYGFLPLEDAALTGIIAHRYAYASCFLPYTGLEDIHLLFFPPSSSTKHARQPAVTKPLGSKEEEGDGSDEFLHVETLAQYPPPADEAGGGSGSGGGDVCQPAAAGLPSQQPSYKLPSSFYTDSFAGAGGGGGGRAVDAAGKKHEQQMRLHQNLRISPCLIRIKNRRLNCQDMYEVTCQPDVFYVYCNGVTVNPTGFPYASVSLSLYSPSKYAVADKIHKLFMALPKDKAQNKNFVKTLDYRKKLHSATTNSSSESPGEASSQSTSYKLPTSFPGASSTPFATDPMYDSEFLSRKREKWAEETQQREEIVRLARERAAEHHRLEMASVEEGRRLRMMEIERLRTLREEEQMNADIAWALAESERQARRDEEKRQSNGKVTEDEELEHAICASSTVFHVMTSKEPQRPQMPSSGKSGRGGVSGRVDMPMMESIPRSALTLGHRLGAGTTSVVYSGSWRSSPVAIKVLRIHDEQMEKALRAELAVLAGLHHPRVLMLMAICNDMQIENTAISAGGGGGGGEIGLVVELMEKGSLFAMLRDASSPPALSEALRIAADVCDGMRFLHASRLIHRDLKSGNVLVQADGRAKVSDFGLSGFRDASTSYMTGITGTPAWAAPEALREEQIYSSCDVYSFGVILWELLTKQVPWAGMSQYQIIRRVSMNDERLAIPPASAACPEAVRVLLQKCFLPAEERPTFDELYVELNACMDTAKQTCLVCGDGFSHNEGIVCSGRDGHFLCNSCFNASVQSQCSRDSLGQFRHNDCRVVCEFCPQRRGQAASVVFEDRDVALHATKAVYERYTAFSFDARSGKLLEEERTRAEVRLQEELKKDATERDLRRFLNHIIETILTDKCPTCTNALDLDGFDFEGMCTALKCDSCPKGSACCGWCFAACGNDSHAHVKTCSQNPMPNKNYYTTREQFFQVQTQRKGQRIEAYIAQQVPATLREAVRREALALLAHLV